MQPLLPLGFRDRQYYRRQRPRAFWTATLWNATFAAIFLLGGVFADFKL
jgi:hypothetical protein